MYANVQLLQGSDVDITKEEFVAINCLVQVHKNTPLNELLSEKAFLQEKVYSRQEQMKVLVRDNFARFVGCKDLLDGTSIISIGPGLHYGTNITLLFQIWVQRLKAKRTQKDQSLKT